MVNFQTKETNLLRLTVWITAVVDKSSYISLASCVYELIRLQNHKIMMLSFPFFVFFNSFVEIKCINNFTNILHDEWIAILEKVKRCKQKIHNQVNATYAGKSSKVLRPHPLFSVLKGLTFAYCFWIYKKMLKQVQNKADWNCLPVKSVYWSKDHQEYTESRCKVNELIKRNSK